MSKPQHLVDQKQQQNTPNKWTKRLLFFFIFVSLASFFTNAYFLTQFKAMRKNLVDVEGMRQQYPYLDLGSLIDNSSDVLINFLPLRRSLHGQVHPYADTFGVYFEYLSTGSSIGINEKDQFIAASLIKLPTAMAIYRQAEKTNKNILSQTVTITQADIDDKFGDLWKRGVGTQLTLGEAVRLSLVDSDNTAFQIISRYGNRDYFNEVYEGLDIDLTMLQNGEVTISPKSYASVLKSLYFASVLNNQDSQDILKMLMQTSFNDRLVAGVPSNVTVAHKIGEYYASVYQDCGIVYVPHRPYVLCMVSKTDKAEAINRMKTVSKMVYDYVSTVNN